MSEGTGVPSYHCIKRARERLGINKARTDREVEKAFVRGKRADCFKQKKRNYLLSKESDGCFATVYNGSCFIFSRDGVCITVFSLPVWFTRKTHYDGKKEIKKPLKYARYNPSVFFKDK